MSNKDGDPFVRQKDFPKWDIQVDGGVLTVYDYLTPK